MKRIKRRYNKREPESLDSIDLSTEGGRVRYGRILRGLSQSQLAKLIKVTTPSINKIEKDMSKNSGHLIAIASVLGFDAEYLKYGRLKNGMRLNKNGASKTFESSAKHPTISSYIRILSWEKLSKRLIKEPAVDELNEYEPTTLIGDGSLDSFALIMEGNAMLSRDANILSFYPGDILYFDPDRDLTPGCKVVALTSHHKYPVFRQYVKDGGNDWLVAYNHQYPAIPFKDVKEIYGVYYCKISYDKKRILKKSIK
jgi:SOS-response transcriptional repressor LexA